MSFWDSSALLPLILREPTSNQMRTLWFDEQSPIVWWATLTECQAAIARRVRENMAAEQVAEAGEGLRLLADFWLEVPPSDAVRTAAQRVLGLHPLRAADALQLAAAFVAADGKPGTLPVVTLDDRLAEAARKEGSRFFRSFGVRLLAVAESPPNSCRAQLLSSTLPSTMTQKFVSLAIAHAIPATAAGNSLGMSKTVRAFAT